MLHVGGARARARKAGLDLNSITMMTSQWPRMVSVFEGDVCEAITGEHRWQRDVMVLQERARLAAEIEAMRTGPSPLEEAHAKHQEHVSDRDKFRSLLINLQVRTLRTTVCSPVAGRSRYISTLHPAVPLPLASVCSPLALRSRYN